MESKTIAISKKKSHLVIKKKTNYLIKTKKTNEFPLEEKPIENAKGKFKKKNVLMYLNKKKNQTI